MRRPETPRDPPSSMRGFTPPCTARSGRSGPRTSRPTFARPPRPPMWTFRPCFADTTRAGACRAKPPRESPGRGSACSSRLLPISRRNWGDRFRAPRFGRPISHGRGISSLGFGRRPRGVPGPRRGRPSRRSSSVRSRGAAGRGSDLLRGRAVEGDRRTMAAGSGRTRRGTEHPGRDGTRGFRPAGRRPPGRRGEVRSTRRQPAPVRTAGARPRRGRGSRASGSGRIPGPPADSVRFGWCEKARRPSSTPSDGGTGRDPGRPAFYLRRRNA